MITREQLKELILSNVDPSEMSDLIQVIVDKYKRSIGRNELNEEQLDEIAETIAETFIPPIYDNEE